MSEVGPRGGDRTEIPPGWPDAAPGWSHCNHGEAEEDLRCAADHHQGQHPEEALVYETSSILDAVHWDGQHWHLECAFDEAVRRLEAKPE